MTQDSLSYGTAIIGKTVLGSMERLWSGELTPDDIPRCEIAVRAFLSSKKLVAEQIEIMESIHHGTTILHGDYNPPFGDHLLDYEFVQPENLDIPKKIPNGESQYLKQYVLGQVLNDLRAKLPSWIETKGQAYEYLDNWYQGETQDTCESAARDPVKWASETERTSSQKIISEQIHEAFHLGTVWHAEYYVRAHRTGMVVYSESSVAKICTKFLFSEWPQKVFESLDDEYKHAMREIRGPGISIDLPPMLSMLLSRAPNREDIPKTLINMREEYSKPREKLWNTLETMWSAHTVSDQVELLAELQDAAQSIFPAAFPQKLNKLSLGLDIAKLSPAGAAGVAQKLLDHNAPKAKVSAVSFTRNLSMDLSKHLVNSRVLYRKHFSAHECELFGVE